MRKIEALLFTHEYSDHTAGLDDIRPFFFKQGAIPIYAHQRVLKNLEKRFDYIFETENKYPGAPSIIENEVVNNQPFTVNNETIVPVNEWIEILPVEVNTLRNFIKSVLRESF